MSHGMLRRISLGKRQIFFFVDDNDSVVRAETNKQSKRNQLHFLDMELELALDESIMKNSC